VESDAAGGLNFGLEHDYPYVSDLDQAKAEIEMGVSAVHIAVD
jgi:hypothetical protein